MSASGNRDFVKHRNISRTADSVRFAIREWSDAKRLNRYLQYSFLFVLTAALLAYLGPFGTWASLAFSDRLMFWTTTVGANWIIAHVVFATAIRTFRARRWATWIGLGLAAFVAALPGTGVVWLTLDVFLAYRPSDLSDAAHLLSQVFVLHLIVGPLVFHLVERTRRRGDTKRGIEDESLGPEESTDAVTRAASEAPLLARLPAYSRAELLHLRMQDHYVEVHTSTGRELLLLRFRDALREVEEVNGLQVHRSHWVARNAVAGVERRGGGRFALRLVNGTSVPVSRSFAPVLRSRGWI